MLKEFICLLHCKYILFNSSDSNLWAMDMHMHVWVNVQYLMRIYKKMESVNCIEVNEANIKIRKSFRVLLRIKCYATTINAQYTRFKNIYLIQFGIECVHCMAIWIECAAAAYHCASHSSKFGFHFMCTIAQWHMMHKHMETNYLTEIIHPIFGRKCCFQMFAYL